MNKPYRKHDLVKQYLCEYIRDHDLKPGDRLPTEQQLIATLSVSRITIRHAISILEREGVLTSRQGSGCFISENSIQEKSSPQYIPLVLPDSFESSSALKIIQGAESALALRLMHLTIHFSQQNPETEREIIQRLVDMNINCIMVFPCSASYNNEFYSRLQRRGIHFVFIDRLPWNHVSNLVSCDNIEGGYLAANHLLSKGCTRFAYLSLSPKQEAPSLEQRFAGYCKALLEAGVSLDQDNAYYINKGESLKNTLKVMMSKTDAPDAIFCSTDFAAIQVVEALDESGILVPDQVCVVGFDNLPQSKRLQIPITSIEQSFDKLGRKAAEIAGNILEGHNQEIVQIVLPVHLIKRKSSMRVLGLPD